MNFKIYILIILLFLFCYYLFIEVKKIKEKKKSQTNKKIKNNTIKKVIKPTLKDVNINDTEIDDYISDHSSINNNDETIIDFNNIKKKDEFFQEWETPNLMEIFTSNGTINTSVDISENNINSLLDRLHNISNNSSILTFFETSNNNIDYNLVSESSSENNLNIDDSDITSIDDISDNQDSDNQDSDNQFDLNNDNIHEEKADNLIINETMTNVIIEPVIEKTTIVEPVIEEINDTTEEIIINETKVSTINDSTPENNIINYINNNYKKSLNKLRVNEIKEILLNFNLITKQQSKILLKSDLSKILKKQLII